MFSMVGDSFAIKTSFLQRMRDLSLNFFELSNSTYFFDIMSVENPKNNFSYTKVLLTISIVGSVPFVISKIRKKSESGEIFLFLAITSCISFLLQSSVQGLNRPWHLFQLYPPLILLSAESLRSLRKIKLVSPLVYIATFGLLTIQAQNIISILDRVKNTNGINEFSPNIRECANTLVENGISDLYILNYSVGEPLYVYSKGQIAFHDLYWGEKKHILDQLKNNHIIQRIAFRRPVQTKSTFGTQLEFLKGPLDEAEKLEFFEVEFQCIDKGGSAITIARRKK